MDAGLPQIKGKLIDMAMLAEDMVARSVKALLTGDVVMAHQVCEDDDQLDRLEAEVDELVVQILAAGFEPKDLRAITISMKICNLCWCKTIYIHPIECIFVSIRTH